MSWDRRLETGMPAGSAWDAGLSSLKANFEKSHSAVNLPAVSANEIGGVEAVGSALRRLNDWAVVMVRRRSLRHCSTSSTRTPSDTHKDTAWAVRLWNSRDTSGCEPEPSNSGCGQTSERMGKGEHFRIREEDGKKGRLQSWDNAGLCPNPLSSEATGEKAKRIRNRCDERRTREECIRPEDQTRISVRRGRRIAWPIVIAGQKPVVVLAVAAGASAFKYCSSKK